MRLVLLVGLPASGKSHYAATHRLPALSSDAVRALLTGDESDQSHNGLVFTTLRSLAAARLRAGVESTVIDATSITRRERRTWLRWAELHDCPVEAVFFDTPLEECLRRNALRARRVPEPALRRMAARLEPPLLSEGFATLATIVPPPPATTAPGQNPSGL